MVEKLLNQNGREVQVAGTRVRAVFQSVTGKLERLVQLDPGPLACTAISDTCTSAPWSRSWGWTWS